MLRKKIVLILLLSLIVITATGCWDKVEIEKRAFILGIALDKAEEEGKVIVTFQLALPQAFGTESEGDGGAYWNITEVTQDIASARRRLLHSINWIPTFEHCQILLIGEALAKEGLNEHIDFFFRTYDVRRRMEVAVVNGLAKDALEIEVKSEPVPSFLISEIKKQNSMHSFEVTNFNYIGRVHEEYILHSEFMLSRIILSDDKDKVDITGAGLFKDFRLVGWFSGEELRSARMLRGDINSGTIGVDLPDNLGGRIMLRIFDAQTSMKAEFRDNQLYLVSRVRLEGDIEEIKHAGTVIANTGVLREIEKYANDYLEESIRDVFKKAQQQFEADPFRFSDRVLNTYPNFWLENNQKWDEIYQTVEIDVQVDVRIRRIGEINY